MSLSTFNYPHSLHLRQRHAGREEREREREREKRKKERRQVQVRGERKKERKREKEREREREREREKTYRLQARNHRRHAQYCTVDMESHKRLSCITLFAAKAVSDI